MYKHLTHTSKKKDLKNNWIGTLEHSGPDYKSGIKWLIL
jgi:hypothetical protein